MSYLNQKDCGTVQSAKLSTDSMPRADAGHQHQGYTMKMRLLITLVAATALSGCASTYDYAAGSAPGGYYVGRAPAASYGPFDSGYGYGGMSLGYGYGNYGGFGGYGYSRPYYGYGGYYPYYPYRPYHPHPPRPPRPDIDTPRPPGQGDRPPPWRRPDGNYQESGRVMIPPRRQAAPQPGISYPDRSQMAPSPRPMAPPSAPRAERSSPVERMERSESRVRERTEEP